MGFGEVDGGAQAACEVVVLGHFFALVPGDRQDMSAAHAPCDSGDDVGAASGGDLDVDRQPGDALDKGDHCDATVLADDEVALRVAELCAVICSWRALGDHRHVFDSASAAMGVRPGPPPGPWPGHEASDLFPAGGVGGVEPVVDSLGADRR